MTKPKQKEKTMNPVCDEAEAFAMSLLMPKTAVYQECLKLAEVGIPRSERPAWIGRLFGVPERKATVRLRELGL